MFFDAKVLVLSRFEAAPNRSLARRRTISACEGDETLRIGRRVLREYLATVMRPQCRSAAISMDDALDRVVRLQQFSFWPMAPRRVGCGASRGQRPSPK